VHSQAELGNEKRHVELGNEQGADKKGGE